MPVRFWERDMPRISDAFTDIAIYVYSCLDDAQRGAKQGGSGFLVHVQFVSNPEMAEVYVVTNDHVVRNARNPVIRLNRKDGTVECIPTEGDQWISHRNGADVSVLPLDTDF